MFGFYDFLNFRPAFETETFDFGIDYCWPYLNLYFLSFLFCPRVYDAGLENLEVFYAVFGFSIFYGWNEKEFLTFSDMVFFRKVFRVYSIYKSSFSF